MTVRPWRLFPNPAFSGQSAAMAVLPFRPTPFFANKNRAFWRLQVAGWGGAMLLRAMSSLANDQPLSFLVLVLIANTISRKVSETSLF